MDYPTWQPYYRHICQQFGYRSEDDLEAARTLSKALKRRSGDRRPADPHPTVDRPGPGRGSGCHGRGSRPGRPARQPGRAEAGLRYLRALLDGAKVEVVGAALEPGVYRRPPPPAVVIAADGAAAGLREADVVPDLVVSDLDGPREALARAAGEGARFILHAHGDNQELLERGVTELDPLIGTCQCEPPAGLYNFGGFTDGDRAVFLAAALGAKHISLAGFDFTRLGQYSFHADPKVKRAKLAWASKLIELAGAHHGLVIEGLRGGYNR